MGENERNNYLDKNDLERNDLKKNDLGKNEKAKKTDAEKKRRRRQRSRGLESDSSVAKEKKYTLQKKLYKKALSTCKLKENRYLIHIERYFSQYEIFPSELYK